MVRGPMALFGAIIAVGLGPALWLGAQFGQLDITPSAPPPKVTVDADRGNAPGRAGAAVDESSLEAPEKIVRENTGRELVPLSSTPSSRPSSRAPQLKPTPGRTVSIAPTRPTAPPTPSSPPPSSTVPAESTTTTPPVQQPSTPVDPPSTPADTPSTDAGAPTDALTPLPTAAAQSA